MGKSRFFPRNDWTGDCGENRPSIINTRLNAWESEQIKIVPVPAVQYEFNSLTAISFLFNGHICGRNLGCSDRVYVAGTGTTYVAPTYYIPILLVVGRHLNTYSTYVDICSRTSQKRLPGHITSSRPTSRRGSSPSIWRERINRQKIRLINLKRTLLHLAGTKKRTKSFGEESLFPNQYDSQKRMYVLCVK